ncbi:MAG: peptidylprolyl isomerase [Arcobacteraceae bacterium]|nr:peptidylprolyl isomerase [Arcobacteraceae bacterium]
MSIEKNNVVSIEYTVTDAGTKEVVDTNVDGSPLEFIVGAEQIIPGLEAKLVGLNKDDKSDIIVAPENGYGEYNDEATQQLPKEQFADVELVKGMTLYGSGENGETVQVIVKDFDNEEVVIDYNHPLAGKTLMFTVMILDIRDATEEELSTGVVGGMAQGGCGCGDGSCDTPEPEELQSNSCCSGGQCS